jgi:hypothetical protein
MVYCLLTPAPSLCVCVGLLDPDPWKRWTAFQASQHPFITGQSGQLRKKGPETKLDYKEENQANRHFDVYWVPPWDPGICRRKLLSVQRMREKQNDRRRGFSQSRPGHGMEGADRGEQPSPSMNSAMVADSPSVGHMSVDGSRSSPPSQIASKQQLQREYGRSGKAGAPAALASSMSALVGAGIQGQLQMESLVRHEHLINTPSNASTHPRFAGPQSYTVGNFESAPVEADFAYALQRPGNVPGLGRDDATVASQASLGQMSMASSQTGHHSVQQRHQHAQQPYGAHGRLPHQDAHAGYQLNSANSVNSLPNAYPNQSAGMLSGGGVSFQGYGNSNLSSSGQIQQGGVQYLAAQQRLQKERALAGQQQQMQQQAMDPYHHELLIQEQQKQLLALQQQHQAQLVALQQQQQLAALQQQQQQLSMNQYGQTGNGYYYVTSADGTPMLMQGGGVGQPMGASYGSAAGNAYMMPPQQPGSQRDRTTDRRQQPGHGQGGSYRR